MQYPLHRDSIARNELRNACRASASPRPAACGYDDGLGVVFDAPNVTGLALLACHMLRQDSLQACFSWHQDDKNNPHTLLSMVFLLSDGRSTMRLAGFELCDASAGKLRTQRALLLAVAKLVTAPRHGESCGECVLRSTLSGLKVYTAPLPSVQRSGDLARECWLASEETIKSKTSKSSTVRSCPEGHHSGPNISAYPEGNRTCLPPRPQPAVTPSYVAYAQLRDYCQKMLQIFYANNFFQ